VVDRGRSPIRPTPSPSADAEEASDALDPHRKPTVEAIRFGNADIPVMFERYDRDLDETTAQISAQDLDALLAKARPVPAPPAPRRTLTTQPYDEVTAYVLLDKDTASPEPPGARDEALDDDAPDIEAIDEGDEVELSDDDVEAPPNPRWLTSTPILATPVPVPVAESSAPASQSIPPAGPSSTSPPASSPQATQMPMPPAAARESLPSTNMEWPGAQDRKRRTRMVVGAVGAVAAIGILYLAFTEAEPAPIAPTPAVVEPAPPPPAPIAPKPQSPAEIEARKALSRLREGMGDCVRKAIGSLPGSSPAVPPTLKQASGAGYTALPGDWKTAVWSCSKFRIDAPMAFQLQWQSVKPGAEAVGLAWIDDDGDGEPDRAFGFKAIAKGARDVDLGDVGPMEMRPVLPVR
jgi:hypothetical protein